MAVVFPDHVVVIYFVQKFVTVTEESLGEDGGREEREEREGKRERREEREEREWKREEGGEEREGKRQRKIMANEIRS
jgi:hypothetical protein